MLSRRPTAERIEAEPDDLSLSIDTIFDTLSSRRRRYVLHYLKGAPGPVAIRDLSEQLAAWEHGIDRAQVRPKERKRLYTALHQTHLPRMDSLGVLHYDRNRGVVKMTGALEQFDIYYDMVGRRDIPWSQFYLAIGGLVTAVVSLAVLDMGPFPSLLSPVPMIVGSVLFTGVALYHVLRDRQRVLGATELPPEYVPGSRDPPANP